MFKIFMEAAPVGVSSGLTRCEGVQVSTIARGIGSGDEPGYADELTIAHALHNRTVVR